GLGWVAAGIITFILLGLHIQADTRRQAAGFYISNPTQTLLYRAALGVGVIGVLITAVEIALWFGKAYGGSDMKRSPLLRLLAATATTALAVGLAAPGTAQELSPRAQDSLADFGSCLATTKKADILFVL